MEIVQNITRIKDNILFIKGERFEELTKDTGYSISFIYLVACLLLSLPFYLLSGVLGGSLLETLLSFPFFFVMVVPFSYLLYGIQFVMLKLLGGKATFLKSVQVFIYGNTPGIIFGNIPCLGFIAALIGLSNVVIGSAKIHQISLLRAIIALIVLPLLIIVVPALLLGALSFYTEMSGPLLRPA